ncbi:hypothetical protein L1987_66617 [Smallanthus sonchifolius]|uniref:Uncharacterized protein n=1 Tax=Smallanthus sonchifolius TaxID=185202 RepID=A0ACB9BXL3_9ASTR|nr:hypothetical protein L1987_66617 [Smallanthus sonchifolius]
MVTSFYNHETPSSYGDRDHLINSHVVILENKCLTGNGSSKKDRHRKINTARGPKDRRIRLSIDVAKKFFKLQDILGFDKASNTIKWLLMKSKPAIQDLRPQQLSQSCSLIGSPSSASECEVQSRIDHLKKRVETVDQSLAKETREKARARARKRATEKRNMKLGCCDGANGDQNRLGAWIPFGKEQIQLTDQAEYPSSQFQFKQGGIFGEGSSMMSANWSPSLLLNYKHNLGTFDHEHQFGDDFQIVDDGFVYHHGIDDNGSISLGNAAEVMITR